MSCQGEGSQGKGPGLTILPAELLYSQAVECPFVGLAQAT